MLTAQSNNRLNFLIIGCLLLALAIPVSGAFAGEDDSAKVEEKMEKKEADDKGSIKVMMKTNMGDIVLELDREKAPITVANFLNYVDKGFYDGTIFHRVMGTFMIQGGGFTEDFKKKETDAPIQNEWENGLKNARGTIAMARLGRQPHSATAQFFINVVDNGSLDVPRDGAGYAVFGYVVEGMDVVDTIRKVKTAPKGMHVNAPAEPVIILKCERLK